MDELFKAANNIIGATVLLAAAGIVGFLVIVLFGISVEFLEAIGIVVTLCALPWLINDCIKQRAARRRQAEQQQAAERETAVRRDAALHMIAQQTADREAAERQIACR